MPRVYLESMGVSKPLTTCAFFILLAACKPANQAVAPNPVQWAVKGVSGQSAPSSAVELSPRGKVTLQIAAAIDTGWYIYSLTQKTGGPTPMSLTVAPFPSFKLDGKVTGPVPVVVYDKEFGIDTERYQGSPTFSVPITADSLPQADAPPLSFKVRFQACNATLCLPAKTVTLETPIRIAANH